MDPNASTRHLRRLAREPAERIEAQLRRARVQVEFARELAAGSELEGAFKRAEAVYGRTPEGDLSAWVAEIESELAPVGKLAKEHTVHCVGHGHIDMNWMWSWPETAATTHDTFASVLGLMDRYPELTYSQSQASVYALVEELYPEMFEQIRARVREGRWEVAAVHWVEGDKNLASGESLARHLLYTRRYFKDKFGLEAEDVELDWEPDTFGHANTIPGIDALGGVKYYYSCRTGGGFDHCRVGDARPALFWWKGPNGARLLVNRETTWYNSYVNIGENFALPLVRFCRETGLRDWLNVYGVGNHGGGPTRDEIEWFLAAREYPVFPKVVFSTATRYFRKIAAEIDARGIVLPEIDHELNFEFTGCYTSQSAIKRANRFGENYCVEAEQLSVIARALDPNFPDQREKLRKAWINVLFNQFHDILPGSGVAATREHAMGLFQETAAITGAAKRMAAQRIVAEVDTLSILPDNPEARDEANRLGEDAPFEAGAGLGAGMSGFSEASGAGRRFYPVVVFNPCAWRRSELVEAHLYDDVLDPVRLVAVGPDGKAQPTLMTYHSPYRKADWGHDKTSILFPAIDVPPLGYKTYVICEGAPDSGSAPQVRVHSDTEIETPFLKAALNRYSPEAKVGIGILGEWDYVTEQPRGMTAWVLGGETSSVPLRTTSFGLRGVARDEGRNTAVGNQFAVQTVQDLSIPDSESKVKLTTTFHGLAPRIDFEAEIDWREIGTQQRGIPGLVVSFESGLGNAEAIYETPFGSVQREGAPGDVPTLRFAHLRGPGGKGMTVTQDSKYGFSHQGGKLRMRVVRSSFDPDHAPEVGKQTVRFSVVLHEKDPSPAELARLGAERNHPLMVLPASVQRGSRPASASFLSVEPDSVVLTSLKPREDGAGLIVRLVEMNGDDVTARVTLAPELLGGISSARRVDLLEQPIEGEALLENGVVTFGLSANDIATVLLS